MPFGNLIYTRGDFSAGMRYESYLDPIFGLSWAGLGGRA